jgi:hypothetical protein|tara:strand:+ start:134 stop:286 length:153 start_codon:yes stop_codon:yes gene_type:complete
MEEQVLILLVHHHLLMDQIQQLEILHQPQAVAEEIQMSMVILAELVAAVL